MGIKGIGHKAVQATSDVAEVAKTEITSRTRTTKGLIEGIKEAKGVVDSTSSTVKLAAAITGSILGTALKPFIFNPEKAKVDLKNLGFRDTELDRSSKELKQLRSDLRAINKTVSQLQDKSDFAVRTTEKMRAKESLSAIRKEAESALSEQTTRMLKDSGFGGIV